MRGRLVALAVWAVAQGCGDSGGLLDAGLDGCFADGGEDEGGTGPGDDAGDDAGSPGEIFCAQCDESARCDPEAKTPTCACEEGYEHEAGLRSACIDIDECDRDEDDCDRHARCMNTQGGFECECRDGWAGDGTSCDDIDECEEDEDDCDAHARCENTEGGFECTCKKGFEGDGTSCDDIDECENGDAECDGDASCENTPGSFECACNAPLVGDGTSCACDMTGTFATLVELDVEWDPLTLGSTVLVDGGSATLRGYAIRRQLQDGTSLTVEVQDCGGTTNDLCSPFFDEAYAQYVPDAVFDLPSMPRTQVTMELDDPDPGEAFIGPVEATLEGLDLADDFAVWPAAQDDAAITWLDHDADDGTYTLTPTPLGITSFVPQSGMSSSCNLPYAALPIPGSANRAGVIMNGSRSTASLQGTIVSCDVIGGRLGGPATCRGEDNTEDVPCFDARIRNCLRSNGDACSGPEVSALDSALNDPGQTVLGARFVMERVDDAISCAEVRAHAFPEIPTPP